MPRFYETTLSITNLHNLSISTHVNRSRMIKLRSIELRGRSYTARTTRYNVPASDTAGSMDASAPFPAASAVGIRVAVSSVRDGNNPYEDCQTSETPFFTPYDNTYQHADNRPPPAAGA